ncbi:hypothetical protein, partial [Burkholderia cenocepacia]|uniref:hypothetical protein n=1 Tax=Burkholderia cenocepacia TaxID=95486 RepID=UPI00406BF911
ALVLLELRLEAVEQPQGLGPHPEPEPAELKPTTRILATALRTARYRAPPSSLTVTTNRTAHAPTH